MNDPFDSNKPLLQILEDSSLGLATFDSAYHFLRVNRSLGEITARTEQELKSLTLVDMIHPEYAANMIMLLQQLFRGQTPSLAIEQRWIKKNGETFWVKVVVSVISDGTGISDKGVVLVENINRQKQLEIDYQWLRERVNQTEQLVSIGRLVSTLTHEINNSMHVVQGLLSLSLEELDNPVELSSYLTMSLAESAKVVDLISRLRYSYHALPAPPEILQLNPLLEEVIALARQELRRKNIHIQTFLAPELPPITSQLGQLYLIFLSLLLNMSEVLAKMGDREIEIRSGLLLEGVQVTLLGKFDDAASPGADFWRGKTELDLGLSFSRDKIIELGGNLAIEKQNEGIACIVNVPFSIPEEPTSV